MKDTFNVLFFIRKTRLLKNGEAAIQMRITVNGQYQELYTKRQVNPKYWNQKKGQTIGKSPELVEINRLLINLRARAFKIHTELIENNLTVNALIVKERLIKGDEKPHPKMFYEEFEAHNVKCKKLQGIDFAKSTVDRYILCLDYFKEMRYLKTIEEKEVENVDVHKKIKNKEIVPEDFPMEYVSKQMIEDFEFFLKTRKNISHNTCIRYLKCVQKIINNGFDNGWIKANPFASISFQETKGKVLFLTMIEVNLLMGKEFTIKRLEQVRDVFVFCCFTGLAFIDVWQLRKEHIVEDGKGGLWIMKERQKTKIDFSVPLLDIPLKLIEKYKDDPYCQKSGHLLPVISNQKMNGYLKEIADLCGIKKTLTTHMARHTFATSVTLANDVSIMNVSKMLGHTKLSMTQHYAKVLDQSIRKDMENVKTLLDTSQPDMELKVSKEEVLTAS